MKRLAILLLIVAAALPSCVRKNSSSSPGFQHFKISIEQDGLIRDGENYTVSLKKQPFTIIVSLASPGAIFINAWLKPDSFAAALRGDAIDDIPGFRDPGLDEELFNKDETLTLSATAPNFWHYAGETDHRFTEVIARPDALLCRRNIAHLNVMDQKKKIDLRNLRENELFLVFMKVEWNNDFSRKIEIKREFVRLDFSDPDRK
jgi:hypothetical protein